jgi:hypothetical protein
MSVWVLTSYEVSIAEGEVTLLAAGEEELATLTRILARSGLVPFTVSSNVPEQIAGKQP